MVMLADDVVFAVLAGILTVAKKCTGSYNAVRKNGLEYYLLLLDLQRITAMYMLDTSRFSEDLKEEAKQMIVNVGIEISGNHTSGLGKQIQELGNVRRLALESLEVALHEKLSTL